MKQHTLTTAIALVSILTITTGADPGASSPLPPLSSADLGGDRVRFALEYGSETSSLSINSAFLLPGEFLDASVLDETSAQYELEAPFGRVERHSARSWRWQAPQTPGLYPLRVRPQGSAFAMTLNVFVMVPAIGVRDGTLNGYRIGDYPSKALNDLPVYQKPRGFIEVTPALAEARLSPHFTLGQFLCKEEGEFPKYIVLRERLILKLEHLLQRVRELGYASESFHVMSGFRTPLYNRAIGNVAYSRHVWGDAADIFIDADEDGVMDDLNRDGRIDLRDAQILYDIADGEERDHAPHFTGGLGKYSANAAHGPFVHVDARGTPARW